MDIICSFSDEDEVNTEFKEVYHEVYYIKPKAKIKVGVYYDITSLFTLKIVFVWITRYHGKRIT